MFDLLSVPLCRTDTEDSEEDRQCRVCVCGGGGILGDRCKSNLHECEVRSGGRRAHGLCSC